MVSLTDFGEYTTSWCPGCGNFGILQAVKESLVSQGIAPHELVYVSGIGQAAKAPHYLRANAFNGLHGRALPPAQGIKIANRELHVLVSSGDGCSYGEGGNHFLAAIRRNVDITLLVHNNQIYGLTKGQASPTTSQGQATKVQPLGSPSSAFNPLAVAIAMGCSFVARGFSGQPAHLAPLITQAMQHKGFSLVDIMQPCVSFNKINTFKWYQSRCYELGPAYDATSQPAALAVALESPEERIALGVLYREEKPDYHSFLPLLQEKTLVHSTPDRQASQTMKNILETFT